MATVEATHIESTKRNQVQVTPIGTFDLIYPEYGTQRFPNETGIRIILQKSF